MAGLDRLLADAEDTHRKMLDALASDGERAIRDIVRLRTRFATLVAELVGAIRADPRLLADLNLAEEFEERFFAVRKRLAEHQSQWRAAAIEKDVSGYRRSANELAQVQGDFYQWARSALSDA
ncbi:hypothetical protein FHS61_003146 [Altererythrobacter atlanticus]|uniref:Uncharacterized protein n=1 Tax=Croceibacterium atlanticum TaxID=1267766 RepID=A0A0F7KUU7_9SPHN|nr:hypothetical protein [Croceibacterium atlanticum]AKH42946.1 hypothetical protein WYH_01911 [Croceibacterium atlanticum]MBB5734097.1 hypothetical protein [Croceibacterium atlanticum]